MKDKKLREEVETLILTLNKTLDTFEKRINKLEKEAGILRKVVSLMLKK